MSGSLEASQHPYDEGMLHHPQNCILVSDHFQTIIIENCPLIYHFQGTKSTICNPSSKIDLRKTTISNASLNLVVGESSQLRHTPHRFHL